MDWIKGAIIGRGSSATVSLATTVTGHIFAVKSAELSSSRFLQKEQQFLSTLRSPHVIEYIGFDVDYDDSIPMYNLFMEYAPGGTISDVIKKQGGCLDEGLIRSYTRQILLGLDYLHSNNLVHCDIKCQNLLVANDGVKIGDLGCAKSAENGGVASSVFSGTPVFMAPEVARGEEQGFAADVWALGCAVIEMATGSNPWPELNNPVSALYRIGYSGDIPFFPMWLSVEAKDFLNKCLRTNAQERWTVKELLQHPFVDSKSGSKKIENFPKNSPNSILDQGFWDCFEAPEPSPLPARFLNLTGESPVNRISHLVEATPSRLPIWVDEEEWITVRTIQIDNLEVEDNSTESTRMESFSEEEFSSSSVTRMLESIVVEMNGASVVVSRFVDCKNMNNNNKILLLDSDFSFALSALIDFGTNTLVLSCLH
ncbi:hypothetical protein L1887_25563 [Cichorium endivia]|nr:hypothetical protein L1887_25563 [Cichorium endivia]